MRALLSALDLWVREDVPPPDSKVPSISEGTAVPRESLQPQWTSYPGAAWVSHLPQRLRMDFGDDPDAGILSYPPKEAGAYSTLVSSLDESGNDAAGIRLPDVSVPLASYAGWNARAPEMGQGGLMTSGAPLFGSTLVLPRTKSEREAKNDPRASIEERYGGKDAYLSRVRAAAQELVASRYMLQEDVERVVATASKKWDAFHAT
jgi:hypothetical protein